jgi:hypothetical protein
MWGEHVVNFAISEDEVTKLQCHNLMLVCSNCAYSFQEVRRNQGVFEVSGHAISIYCDAQGWNISE